MKHGIVVSLGVSIAAAACERPAAHAHSPLSVAAVLSPDRFVVDTLQPRVIADTTLLRRPRYVASSQTFIAVADEGTDSLLNLFDRPTLRFVGAVGNRRPRENLFVRTGSLRISDGPSATIQMIDPISGQLLVIGVGSNALPQRVQEIDSTASVEEPFFLPDGRFFAFGLRIKGRFGLFAPNGQMTRALGRAPSTPDSAPIFVRQHVARSLGTLNMSYDRLAMFEHYSDRLEIYDTTGTLAVTGERPIGFEPEYTVGLRRGAPSVGLTANSRISYVAVAADSNLIFALFSGRAIGAKGPRAFLGDKIIVFGWDGRIRRVLQLSGDMGSIAVTPDGEWLYCVQQAPTAALIGYRLKPSPAVRRQVAGLRHE